MSSDPKGTCSNGGLWYTCTEQNPTFLGCCTSDPCNGTGCPDGDLRAAGMGTGPGPDPGFTSNDGSYWPNVQCASGQWWTCAAQTPSFQGCCDSNPCGGSGSSGGCPDGQLHPAAFKSVTSAAATTSTSPTTKATSRSTSESTTDRDTTTSSPSTKSTSTSLATSSTSTPPIATGINSSPSSSNTPSPIPVSKQTNVGAIAGGAAGGVVLLLAIILLFCYKRRHRQSRLLHQPQSPSAHAETSQNLYGPAEPKTKLQPHTYEAFSPSHVEPNTYEAYYPGRPIFGLPNATKVTDSPGQPSPGQPSPGPPPYASPELSPRGDVHEIYSNPVHEAGGGTIRRVHELDGRPTIRQVPPTDGALGYGSRSTRSGRAGDAELPDSPTIGDNRWRQRRPVGMPTSSIANEAGGVGGPGSQQNPEIGNARGTRDTGESYAGWQNFSP